MDPRPTGIVVGLIGAVVLVVSALADPLGIGEGHTFGGERAGDHEDDHRRGRGDSLRPRRSERTASYALRKARQPEGVSAVLAVGIRWFLVAVAIVAILALVFLLATA